jgi:hypothetical protein
LVLAYNTTLEATWESESLAERAGELQRSLGASYEVRPRLLFGAACLHEVAFPDWSHAGRGKFFAGPLNIPEPIRIIDEDEIGSCSPPPLPAKR